MLKHAKGNLIDMAEAGLFDIIVHGCNCQNVMGSGIAKEIRERIPSAWNSDCEATKKFPTPALKLGNFSVGARFHSREHFFEVVNAYTQLHYLPRGVDHFDYESFALILRKLSLLRPDVRYGFPYIGMGLAGGNGFRIQNMLQEFASQVEDTGGSVTLVEFSG